MKRTAVALSVGGGALLWACGGAVPGSGPAAASKVGDEVYATVTAPGGARVIVALREPAGEGTAVSTSAPAEAVASVQKGVLAQLGPAEFHLTAQWQHVSAFAGVVTSARALDQLEHHPDVLRVDLDRPVQAFMAESGSLIRATDAHAAGATGSGVTVAVIDSGVDASHPDLADHVAGQACFCNGCCPGGSGSAQDDNGHGTNVTGVVAGSGKVAAQGVAPAAAIYAIKVLSASGAGTSTDVVSALDFVAGKAGTIKVVNISLGGGQFSSACDSSDANNIALARSINNLKSKGVVTFAASGNSGYTGAVASPACVSSAVAVGAVYDDNVGGISAGICTDASTRADLVTCFSNSSPLVQLLAPGALITAAGMGGGTSTDAGTSQATPHAAGVAALMLGVKPGLAPDQIVTVLKQTGSPVTDPKNGVTVPRINAMAAVSAVR